MRAAVVLLLASVPAASAEDLSFLRDVAPILVENCTACHNPRKAESKYDMTTFAKMVKGGQTADGDPVIVASQPDESYFLEMLAPDANPRMPYKLDVLPEAQRTVLRDWVAQGAKFDGPGPEVDWVSAYFKSRPVTIPESYPIPVPITALAFTPDGKLASSGFHELNLWTPEGTLAHRLRPARERIHEATYSPDGKWLALAGGDPGQSGTVTLWEVQPDGTAKFIKELLDTSDSVFAVAFSPDGTKLATGGADRAIRVYALPGGEEFAKIEDHADWVLDVAWSDDGARIASASRDKTAKVFDVAKKEAVATFPGHNDAVYAALFVGNGPLVATAGADSKIRVWNPDEEAKQARESGGFSGPIFQLRRSPDKTMMAGCGQDQIVRLFKAENGEQVREFKGAKDWLYALAFAPDGSKLMAGGWDGEVRVWNVADGAEVKTFMAAPGLAPKAP